MACLSEALVRQEARRAAVVIGARVLSAERAEACDGRRGKGGALVKDGATERLEGDDEGEEFVKLSREVEAGREGELEREVVEAARVEERDS